MAAISRFKQAHWRKMWSKRFSVRLAENWLYSPPNFKRNYGCGFPDQLIFIEEETGHGYLQAQQLDACLSELVSRLKSSSFKTVFESRAHPSFKKFLAFSKKLSRQKLNKLSGARFSLLLKSFLEKEDEWMSHVWFVFILDEAVSRETEKLLAKTEGKQAKELMEIVVSPSKETAALSYKLDLLKTARKLALSGTGLAEARKQSRALAQTYAFFTVLNMDEEPLSDSQVLEQLLRLSAWPIELAKQKQHISKSLSGNAKKFSSLLKRFKKDKPLSRMLDACHELAFYREYRNDLRQESYYYARALYLEIARRLEIPISDLVYYKREEIFASIVKGTSVVSRGESAKRKEFFAIGTFGGKVNYFSESEGAKSVFSSLEKPKSNTQESLAVLKGVGASPGIAKGRARVVLDARKSHGFREGDVLVAPTTNLAYVQLMGKASAIVVEGGGLLTHAAIVARELGKPCVVGVAGATRRLKDGALVEVDGSSGIIRKIKT